MPHEHQREEAIRSAFRQCLGGLDSLPSLEKTILRKAREDKPVKKKLSLAAVLAAALLLATAATAVAEALGINLFSWFGEKEKDARLSSLASNTAMNGLAPVKTESDALGSTLAGINSAYYDGEHLMVAYYIQNGYRLEAFQGEDAFLADMETLDSVPVFVPMNEEDDEIFLQWLRAVDSKTPMGLIQYSVSPSDHTIAEGEIDLPPRTESQTTAENGFVYLLREFEHPLPEGARNRDALNIQIGLSKVTVYYYFDGESCRQKTVREQLPPMTASVPRAAAETVRFAGTGVLQGVQVRAEAAVSAAWAQVTVTKTAGAFPALPQGLEDPWYELTLEDDAGRRFLCQELPDLSLDSFTVPFDGTGFLPHALTVRLEVMAEGETEIPRDEAFILLEKTGDAPGK